MKQIAALALLATAAVTASAQSTVTLFGVIDAGVSSVKNGSNTVKSVSKNGLNTSRFGVRGTEDLGGGLLASFWIEGGFNPDNGTQSDGTRLWNRRTTASLIGGFGELRVGRDFAPSYTGWSDFDIFGDNGLAAGGKFNSAVGTNADTLTRADNLVTYFTPSKLGGFYGQVSVAPGEGVNGKKYVGGRAGYAAGPLNVSLALGQTTVTASAAQPGEDKLKVITLGASYDLGVAKLTGYYDQNKYGSLKTTVYNLGVSVPVSALGSVRASYAKLNASGLTSNANDASQIALGGVYNLSKRTALYTTVSRVNNKGGAAYAVGGTAVAGTKSTGYELGFRHAF